LSRADGARADVLLGVTHGARANNVMDLYTTLPWPSVCAEVAKLAVHLPERASGSDGKLAS
jgi:hypothetical protein